MTDDSKNRGGGRGRPPRDGSPRNSDRPVRPRAGDDRPARPRRDDGDRPTRSRSGDDRPARPRREDGDRPFRSRPEGGERPSRSRSEGGDRPFRSRPEGGDRPSRSRPEGGERPFRSRSGEDRPARPRSEGGDRPFRSRPEGGDRPFRSRPDGDRPFRSRSGDEGPARPRRDEGDRPFRARREEGDRPFRSRSGEDRPFRPRFEDRGRGAGPDRREKGPKIRKTFSDRIAKVIARAGLCSRRDAEAWIEEGRVAVNGEVLKSPALDVTERDVVTVDGKPIPTKERTRLYLYHKPRGLVTTAWDPEGRPTVFAALPPGLPRVVTIGRLDINTEGLLLLTNDGGLARVVSLPQTGWLRRYRVRAYGEITQADLDALRDGITVDDMHYGPIEAEIEREKGDNVWLTLGLREGKNREVKRVLEHLGLQVNRLIRVSFGPFQLNDLPEGAVEEVRTAVLKDQLGDNLAAEAECDFDAPVFVYEDEDFHPKKREYLGRKDRDEGERPARRSFGEGDDRGFRGRDRDDDRPRGRFGDREEEAQSEEKPRPKRRAPTEPLRSIWRADENPDAPRTPKARVPRRGADPKAARTESGEREHERAGRIESKSGRKVLVERVKSEPVEEIREERRPRREEGERAFRPREGGGDRPFRSREGGGDRPFKPRGDRPEGERSFRPRTEGGGDRPFRSREGGGDRPFKPRGDRPEGERSFRPRSEGGGDRPFRSREGGGGDRPFKPRGDRPQGDRPSGGRSFGGKPGGGRPFGGKPGGGRPSGGKPGGGGRPGGGRPGGRPRRDD